MFLFLKFRFTSVAIDAGEHNPCECQAPSDFVKAIVEEGFNLGEAVDENCRVMTKIADSVDDCDPS